MSKTQLICFLRLTLKRDFVPDSGRLVHMQLPSLSNTVRVDAGFAAGDEVSAHYDPMIAKLIVQGPTRATAIQKLHTALEEFEVAGLVTNIEFLKQVCKNTAFVSGEVETGFITKQHENLMAEIPVPPEVYAQAALGTYLIDAAKSQDSPFITAPSTWGPTVQSRAFTLVSEQEDGKSHEAETKVIVTHLDTGLFEVATDSTVFQSVACKWDSHHRTLTSFFPHTRLETRIIQDGGDLTLFQHGQKFRMQYATPKWVEKALGHKDTTHSVLAPMPCKILRVEAKAGDLVKKDQILVVIESMKMETVIRSPQDGVISRVVHQEGVSIRVETLAIVLIVLGPLQGRYCPGEF